MGLLRRLALELSNDLGESEELRTQTIVDRATVRLLVGRDLGRDRYENEATINPEVIEKLILNYGHIEHPMVRDEILASARRLCELHDQPDPDALIDLAIVHLLRNEHAEAEEAIAEARDEADEARLKEIDLRIAAWKSSLESGMR